MYSFIIQKIYKIRKNGRLLCSYTLHKYVRTQFCAMKVSDYKNQARVIAGNFHILKYATVCFIYLPTEDT